MNLLLPCRIVAPLPTAWRCQLLWIGVTTACTAATTATVTLALTNRRVISAAKRAQDPCHGSGDALLVFSAQATEAGSSNELRARLDHALVLWRAGVAPVTAVSGGEYGGIDEVIVDV